MVASISSNDVERLEEVVVDVIWDGISHWKFEEWDYMYISDLVCSL
jgi:hypothetical protein